MIIWWGLFLKWFKDLLLKPHLEQIASYYFCAIKLISEL